MPSHHAAESVEQPPRDEDPQPLTDAKGAWDWRGVARWIVVWKVVFFLLVFASFEIWPYWERGEYERHRHWPLDGAPTLESRFATWDAAHYLHLAKDAYKKGDSSCVFYPLLPSLIRGTSYIFGGNLFIAAFLLAQVLAFTGILSFHRVVWEIIDTRTANLAAVVLIAFPGAIFLSFPYTEGLLVTLTSLFLLFLRRRQMWATCLAGFLIPLTSAYGLLCLVPLAWNLWVNKRSASAALSYYGPIAGAAIYFLLMYEFTGNPTEAFEVPGSHPSSKNLVNVPAIITAFIHIGGFHGANDSALDRLVFLAFLGFLPHIWRLDRTLFFYALPTGLVPAFSSLFVSYSRNIMLCLPLFIVLAVHLEGRERRWLRWPLLVGLVGLQVYFMALHINFFWAG
jgi:hypothetical protein